MDRLRVLDVRLPEHGHVIKAAQAGLLEQASDIIAEAEKRAAEILVAAQERYHEEERRGYEAGEARAEREAVARLLEEQAVLDSGLASLVEELTRLVGDCLRQMVGAIGQTELISGFITHAIRSMRRQKRIRLSVSPGRLSQIREHVERVTAEFPEIELIDVQENTALDDLRFLLEAESGRIEGSVETSLAEMENLLLAAIRRANAGGAIPAPAAPDAARPETRP